MNKRRRYRAKARRHAIVTLMHRYGMTFRGARRILTPTPYIHGVLRRSEITIPINYRT